MDSNAKALSGLSYLSVFFLPFIFPIIVFFGSKDLETKRHAKRAFISHLLTIVLSVFLVVIMLFTFVKNNTLNISFLILLSVSFILFIIAFAAIFIWNIVQAVKVVR